MDEKELKTSPKQRIVISVIAFVMLGSIIASYAAIIINGGKSGNSGDSSISQEKIEKYESEYYQKLAEFQAFTEDDFNKFSKYRSEVTAYNETAANNGTVSTRDLVEGDGRELGEADYDYYAYYIGWCADETVFDSSFNSDENPTGFTSALDASNGLIEGWNAGVVGMRLNGIREITVAGELAYGSSREICGGYDKPLRFLVYAKEKTDDLVKVNSDVLLAFDKLRMAYYGIDYDEQY